MSFAVEFTFMKAAEADITMHLRACDSEFVPPLSSRVDINNYAKKIVSKATRFEAWSGGSLIGLLAAYYNDQKDLFAYITSVSVLKEWAGKGIATRLISRCIEHAKVSGMRQISLEVANDNTAAIRTYEKSGFVIGKVNAPFVIMNLYLNCDEKHDHRA
ncbi:MAG: GNAT family N-acetyltransferase [Gammaproteobacteria bacterium]|nr:GNAT family N-acetyltransferase [Gammaproteobacteria bacterium]MDH3465861.1 GNAT family N-acetyltransferase [Gammaproteobacteria bacterium]